MGQALDAPGDGVFVEAYVSPPGERSSKRSSTVKDTNYPAFSDASFEFTVADYSIGSGEIVFVIKSESRYGTANPVGSVSIPLQLIQERPFEKKSQRLRRSNGTNSSTVVKVSARFSSGSPRNSNDSKMCIGAKIEARYRGKSRYYPGRIARVRLNGTYDIDYDDGEKEMGVDKALIRSFESSSRTSPRRGGSNRLPVGAKVEARYRGKLRHYPGRIARAHVNGTYDIDYDDGEKEYEVEASLVRANGGSRSPSRGHYDDDTTDAEPISGKLAVGTKIEARYRGNVRFYPGRIARVRLNGTYDIDYDDGEKEMGVDKALVNATDEDMREKEMADEELTRLESMVQKAVDSGTDVLKCLEHFDTDHSGSIDEDEFYRSLQKLDLDVSRSEARKMMDKFPGKRRGQINIRDFIHGMKLERTREVEDIDSVQDEIRCEIKRLTETRYGRPEFRQMFEEIDRDGGGSIDLREFQKVLDQLGFELSSEVVKKLCQKFDYNHDGKIAYEAFQKFAEGDDYHS